MSQRYDMGYVFVRRVDSRKDQNSYFQMKSLLFWENRHSFNNKFYHRNSQPQLMLRKNQIKPSDMRGEALIEFKRRVGFLSLPTVDKIWLFILPLMWECIFERTLEVIFLESDEFLKIWFLTVLLRKSSSPPIDCRWWWVPSINILFGWN